MVKFKQLKIKEKYFLLTVFLIFFISLPFLILAEITVSPRIIDQKAKARDLLDFSIKINNDTDSMAWLYPIVINFSEKGDNNSLSDWVEIPRGRIELSAGTEKSIDFSIKIGLNAEPGNYYGTIYFGQGLTRTEAELNALRLNQPEIFLKIEVEDNIIERAQLKRFNPEKNLFFNFPVRFFVEVDNIGNKEIVPSGFIYIYDRKGKEVGTVELVEKNIIPGSKELFLGAWKETFSFGKYKAVLNLEYGTKERRDIQDTIYFWVLPWQFLLFIIFSLFVFTSLLVWFFLKKIKKHNSSSYQFNKVVKIKKKKKKKI